MYTYSENLLLLKRYILDTLIVPSQNLEKLILNGLNLKILGCVANIIYCKKNMKNCSIKYLNIGTPVLIHF